MQLKITLKAGEWELTINDESKENLSREHGNEGADKSIGQASATGNDQPKPTAGFSLPIE